MADYKGLIPTISEMEPAVVEYNPNFSIKEMFDILLKREEEDREWKKKTGWKPEFFLDPFTAEEMPYEWLKALCERYRVIGGMETYEILQRKEDEYKKKNTGN